MQHDRELELRRGVSDTRGSAASGRRRVFIRDLELVASVGVFEVERRYQQRIVVSVSLDVIDSYDGVSDRLDDVLDYAEIVRRITRIADADHTNLIETLAERFAAACLADTRVRAVTVRIEKPDIMPSCKSVGVEITRTSG
ncbi:MAG TPA: dihydroneopterin aldolase [Hyphomicrobiaceae bacterium]|nr:dihydroneopterin aldolase [Hyphomicrobiaceae bacterium]